MRFAGKVSEFNRVTGRGLISSKAAGGNFNFHVSHVKGGTSKLDAGDHVEFEVGPLNGSSQALVISLTSRMAVMQQRAARAELGKPVDDEQGDLMGLKASFRSAQNGPKDALAGPQPPAPVQPLATAKSTNARSLALEMSTGTS